MSTKIYFRALALMLMVTTFLPVVAVNLPRGVGSYKLYAPIWLGSLLFYHHKLFLNKFFLGYGLVFIGVLLNTLWIDMEAWNRNSIISEFYDWSVAISVILYFRMTRDYKGLAWLTKWTMVFFAITAIMTIYSTFLNPLYMRLMMAGDPAVQEQFNKLGGAKYDFIIALLALFPIMIYYYRNNNFSIFSKKQIVFFGILCFVAVLRVQIFANVLLSSVVIFVSLLGSKRLQQSVVLMFLVLIIVYIIPVSIYADLLMSISTFLDPDSEVYYKLTDMATYLAYGNRYATGAEFRAARYPMLIEAFLQNPFFGRFVGLSLENAIGEGGHLYWMNKLATLGIFGIIPAILIHKEFINSAYKAFNKNFVFYFLIAVFAILGLGLMKNIGGRAVWLTYFVLLPGLYFLPLLQKKK